MTSSGRKVDTSKIDLMRGGDVVSTLTGAFGQSLRETRVTAILGYLIARNPKPFLSLFGFAGMPQRVSLELRHDRGRSDILVETSLGTGVIEAKVDATDPLKQSYRYPARWVALLTHRVPPQRNGRERYVSWHELAKLLEAMTRSGSPEFRVLGRDLLGYMQVHRMTRNRNSVEIYAREINEPVTLELFLKARLYGCNYQAGSRLAEALYFAPHFGASITNEHPGINTGISYVARIETVGNATTWNDFRELMRSERGGTWWNRHQIVLKNLRQRWSWNKGQHRSFLLLDEPRLVFNPPIRKEKLQKGKGWLSRRFFAFDELFEAWGK
jgi:hypothetical protein